MHLVSESLVYTAFAPGSCRAQPIVDANDVAKLLLALVFVLDGLGYAERERFNARHYQGSESKEQQSIK